MANKKYFDMGSAKGKHDDLETCMLKTMEKVGAVKKVSFDSEAQAYKTITYQGKPFKADPVNAKSKIFYGGMKSGKTTIFKEAMVKALMENGLKSHEDSLAKLIYATPPTTFTFWKGQQWDEAQVPILAPNAPLIEFLLDT